MEYELHASVCKFLQRRIAGGARGLLHVAVVMGGGARKTKQDLGPGISRSECANLAGAV